MRKIQETNMNLGNNINPNEETSQQTSTSAHIVLILGGARSGKSTFAEHLVSQSGKSVAYIATATAGDEDMRERIRQHQARRAAHWYTVEEPLDLVHALRQASLRGDVILLDCITLWLSNWLSMQGGEQGWGEDPSLHISEINRHIDDLVAEIEAVLRVAAGLGHHKTLVIVSNEVGLGVVPPYALGRLYRDALGRINQCLASAATRVYLMVAGLGVDIKRLHAEASL
jgi:adenosylcobinamide kinase/adenosylcobinamide-phosphate guanylyltransferase